MNELLLALKSTKFWILLAAVPWLCVVSFAIGTKTATLGDNHPPRSITIINELSTSSDIDLGSYGLITKVASNRFTEILRKEKKNNEN